MAPLKQAILSGTEISDGGKAWILGIVKHYGHLFGVFAFAGILFAVVEPWMGEAGRNFSKALKNDLLDWYVWLFFLFVLAYQCAFYAITGPIDTTISRGRLRLAWDSFVSTTRLSELCIASFMAWGGYAFGVFMFVTVRNVYKELVFGSISINPFSAISWPELLFTWVATGGIAIVLVMRLKTEEWVNDPRAIALKLPASKNLNQVILSPTSSKAFDFQTAFE